VIRARNTLNYPLSTSHVHRSYRTTRPHRNLQPDSTFHIGGPEAWPSRRAGGNRQIFPTAGNPSLRYAPDAAKLEV
jgi:hypothetical protein